MSQSVPGSGNALGVAVSSRLDKLSENSGLSVDSIPVCMDIDLSSIARDLLPTMHIVLLSPMVQHHGERSSGSTNIRIFGFQLMVDGDLYIRSMVWLHHVSSLSDLHEDAAIVLFLGADECEIGRMQRSPVLPSYQSSVGRFISLLSAYPMDMVSLYTT